MVPYLSKFFVEIGSPLRIIIILVLMVGLHLSVIGIRRFGQKLMTVRVSRNLSKSRTVASLTVSIIVFLLYFTALGMILSEFGISLKTYLASASILGLAIGFGSQGLVQDVVNGLTIVFSGLLDVGDMVEITGQTGIVKNFGMRFIVLENSLGASVHIPNRTITSVIQYPRGYVRGLVDITLPRDPEAARQIEGRVASIVTSASEQLSGILLTPPSLEGRITTSSGKEFLRYKFRLWPGRGAPLETFFKQELVFAVKGIDPDYQDWMVTVNYEVEKKRLPLT